MFGIDWDGPLPSDVDSDEVSVPSITVGLSPTDMDELIHTINPLDECDDYGINLYMQCVLFVSNKLQY